MNIIPKEVTLKITLAGTPVSRVLLVSDSISLIELSPLLLFCLNGIKCAIMPSVLSAMATG
jgi:hypothetical protein